VWRLDLGELRWERTADLAQTTHAARCGGASSCSADNIFTTSEAKTSSLTVGPRVLRFWGDSRSKALPSLSSGPCVYSAAVAIDVSESEQGQVFLIGGVRGGEFASAAHKVDLATSVCTPLPSLLSRRRPMCTVARLPDGRFLCIGKNRGGDSEGITAEILEELPDQGSLTSEASWRWRELPGMSVARHGCGGCVLSDGRFAVFGGLTDFGDGTRTASCEVLSLDGDDERWDPLPPMHEARTGGFAGAAVGGCVIVTGGGGGATVEVYEEALGRWRRLPCIFPRDAALCWMGSALM
jgi:hypothetical protein